MTFTILHCREWRFFVDWTERGGPCIDEKPDSEGFGSQWPALPLSVVSAANFSAWVTRSRV